MSLFFSLQNTISAYLTVYFSIADMISSVAAKLGDENSTASSTARQRQKIIQSFNSYTSGLNESMNTLMDIFEKSIDKNNEARYQTAISQTDYEFSDFVSQLGNVFFANQFEIEKESLKAKISQDFYRNQYDTRKSMQQAMLDVPNFGPNLMPSGFSHLFLEDD